MQTPLERMGERLARNPYFMAYALAIFTQSEGLDERGLAARLMCSLEVLGHLRLCRRPRTDTATFSEEIRDIAQHYGVNLMTLAEVARRANTLEALGTVQTSQRGLLMAARDRDHAPGEPGQADDAP